MGILYKLVFSCHCLKNSQNVIEYEIRKCHKKVIYLNYVNLAMLFFYVHVFVFSGRTLIRVNEIKLEKMGITNVQHRYD